MVTKKIPKKKKKGKILPNYQNHKTGSKKFKNLKILEHML
jgi:hypothetical protein